MYTVDEVLEYVEEEDVKFVRLAFFDLRGVQKNISIMASQLQSAFENGVSFDASAISSNLLIFMYSLYLTDCQTLICTN